PARHMLNATLNWDASDTLSFALIGEGRYDRYRSHNELTGADQYYSDYTIFHLGATRTMKDSVTLNARVNNLRDRNFISQRCELVALRDAWSCVDDYQVKDKRRSLWLSVNVDF